MTRTSTLAYNPADSLVLDRDSPVPLYFQLAQHVETEIQSGNLDSGDRLENEVKIAEDLGLSRPTVRAAFGYLVDKGLVLQAPRSGHGRHEGEGEPVGQAHQPVRRPRGGGARPVDSGTSQ